MRRLAVLGGEPAFEMPLHVGRPNIGDRQQFMASVNQILDNRWLTNFGPFMVQFEQALCSLLGAKHCLVTSNATVGLEIAAHALGLTGEVIVPAFTFVATAHSLQWQGITPVFCDIDPRTHNIDPRQVEKLITPRTTGILGVHLWGRPCDIEALQETADRRNLKLFFDAAHAFGCAHRGRMIGNFGAAEVFSFHATKFFNAFEGGAIVTNDDDLARRVESIRDFGFAGYDRVVDVGTNGKMTEISAAMGLTNLLSLDDFARINQRNYHRYRRELDALPGFCLIRYDERQRSNFQYMAVEVDAQETGITRDELIKVLHAENVLARRYFWPGCHRMEPYRTLFPHADETLPRTEEVASRILVLPTGSAINEEDIETICDILRAAVTSADEVHQRVTDHG
ncbi:MAG: aminotransferase class I/II-fold pyridoxal phosphate-dependent enzyme [Caldilineaceae bacterium]|nr:aminotransferase class I/II-fold pyridoxal phosphate-dependent enzyme [Caldilineaceae bacterium]MBP8108377.1 aminotransferase class I/II-fold pyridoxal phosphate-dependent enzyme [Caldilineaceae bacterium]MBP8123302.1 aminotransferase class I/II-fold pyridoxal phosphate-dependent enzyme [Caldilineaceae bacterium]MBP9073534.1 aminotransferase class I/II-fold pyridoxal phosphate-dependent enzyme [Caldilineaceae bacterium]